MNIDWTTFTQRIYIKADVRKLYNAWATRNGMEQWFLRLSEYKSASGEIIAGNTLVQKGCTYKWLWHGYGDDTVEHGEIIEANGNDFLKFTFGKAGVVSVSIKTEAGETLVELKQENIPTDEQSKFNYYVGCSTGWVFYMANLKSIYEGGIDLRNKNMQHSSVLNS